MAINVVVQLALGDEHSVDQLLDVPVARVGGYLADELHGSLDLDDVPFLLPLDHKRRAHHVRHR